MNAAWAVCALWGIQPQQLPLYGPSLTTAVLFHVVFGAEFQEDCGTPEQLRSIYDASSAAQRAACNNFILLFFNYDRHAECYDLMTLHSSLVVLLVPSTPNVFSALGNCRVHEKAQEG